MNGDDERDARRDGNAGQDFLERQRRRGKVRTAARQVCEFGPRSAGQGARGVQLFVSHDVYAASFSEGSRTGKASSQARASS